MRVLTGESDWDLGSPTSHHSSSNVCRSVIGTLHPAAHRGLSDSRFLGFADRRPVPTSRGHSDSEPWACQMPYAIMLFAFKSLEDFRERCLVERFGHESGIAYNQARASSIECRHSAYCTGLLVTPSVLISAQPSKRSMTSRCSTLSPLLNCGRNDRIDSNVYVFESLSSSSISTV